MAYSTDNPPTNIGGQNGGYQLWLYVSADASGTVDTADYFSNGDFLGMTVGDAMIVVDTTTPLASTHIVSAVTAGGAATVV